MDYTATISALEELKAVVDQYEPLKYGDRTEERKALFERLCELYGQVSEVYCELAGSKSIEVPDGRGAPPSRYPNYFEAGYLSGRTIHSYQGKTELMMVIGKLKSKPRTMAKSEPAPSGEVSNRVFLVHGHNQAILQTCARFIERLELPLTILSEQPNEGRTIFQKFLDHADVGFAVVLLTADDRGGPKDQAFEEQRPRARQNVLFELGFFIGKLDRNRVCALYEEGVEIPSDYNGVAFVPLDDRGAWKFELVREMKAAGFSIDLNKL